MTPFAVIAIGMPFLFGLAAWLCHRSKRRAWFYVFLAATIISALFALAVFTTITGHSESTGVWQ